MAAASTTSQNVTQSNASSRTTNRSGCFGPPISVSAW